MIFQGSRGTVYLSTTVDTDLEKRLSIPHARSANAAVRRGTQVQSYTDATPSPKVSMAEEIVKVKGQKATGFDGDRISFSRAK